MGGALGDGSDSITRRWAAGEGCSKHGAQARQTTQGAPLGVGRPAPAPPMQPPCSVPYLLATAGVTGSSAVTLPGAASMLCSWRSAVVSKQTGSSVEQSVCEMLACRKPTPRASDMPAEQCQQQQERWRQRWSGGGRVESYHRG